MIHRIIKFNQLQFYLLIIFTNYSYGSTNEGAYINLNSGVGTYAEQSLNSGFMWSLNAGYNFNDYFALEGGYTGIYSKQYQGINFGSNLFDIAIKGSLPISNTFDIYGRLGGGYLINGAQGNMDLNEYNASIFSNGKPMSSVAGVIGGGFSFPISQSFKLNLEDSYISPLNNQVTGINMVSIGLQYNFNSSTNVATPTSNVNIMNSYTTVVNCTNNESNNTCTNNTCTNNDDTNRGTDLSNTVIKKEQNEQKFVIVNKGDTLYSISRRFSVSVLDLKSINNLNNNVIKVGQKIKLPSSQFEPSIKPVN